MRCKTVTAKSGINDALKILRKRIEEVENRINSSFKIVEIDGVKYQLPASLEWYESEIYTLKLENDVLYVIDTRKKYDLNGRSYYWLHHVWIPQGKEKYANLCVRTLGGDAYGDRYFIEVEYFKHPADRHPYLSKRLSSFNRTYKPYADYILRELGLQVSPQ